MKITAFDTQSSTITFSYIGYDGKEASMSVNLKADDKNKLPTGDALLELLQSYIPEAPTPAANAKQIAALVQPVELPYTEEEAARNERSRRIALVEWRVSRYEQQKALVAIGALDATTDTEAVYHELLAYIQLLRDVTNQEGFPTNVQWPEEPAE